MSAIRSPRDEMLYQHVKHIGGVMPGALVSFFYSKGWSRHSIEASMRHLIDTGMLVSDKYNTLTAKENAL